MDLQQRIEDLTAREINGVKKPFMEPGRHIEQRVEDIRDMLDSILDGGLEYVEDAREIINELRTTYPMNNYAVSDKIAKNVARRADAILDDIIAFKSKRTRSSRKTRKVKSRKSRKNRK
jgi:hypothetical protein